VVDLRVLDRERQAHAGLSPSERSQPGHPKGGAVRAVQFLLELTGPASSAVIEKRRARSTGTGIRDAVVPITVLKAK